MSNTLHILELIQDWLEPLYRLSHTMVECRYFREEKKI